MLLNLIHNIKEGLPFQYNYKLFLARKVFNHIKTSLFACMYEKEVGGHINVFVNSIDWQFQ